ncbi:hypothetical protein QOZ80_1AG0021650 [Eleusine coracana subsp. coracana]|nr:hypothetical protein QOZ80_1AG0021650 [Eleusine coracana subsp. coracana]
MDLLCDTLMVEEIMRRLPPKSLLRLSAASRRYNALVLQPDFAARYWQRAGVFFEPYRWSRPVFLPGEEDHGRPPMLAGLLLCSRACYYPAHYYIFNHPTYWGEPGGCIKLKLFSSDRGQWKERQLQCPVHIDSRVYHHVLGQSGTAYWICNEDKAVVFNSVNHSVKVITLPCCIDKRQENRVIGEKRPQGGGLRYAHSNSSAFEVWDSSQTKSDDGDITWMLVHRIGVNELFQRNPDVLFGPSSHIKPIGFHPTNDDIVFFGMPKAVVAYSIGRSTMSSQYTDNYMSYNDVFPFVHPPYPVPIPAIKNSVQQWFHGS